MSHSTVRAVRSGRGLAMRDLALLSGVSYYELSRIETGVVPLSERAAEALGRALNVTPESLMDAHRQMRADRAADVAGAL